MTGQIGYAFNTVLLYVKGGGAVTDTRYSSFSLEAAACSIRRATPVGAALRELDLS